MWTQPAKQYKTIYADPPWDESGGGEVVRGANRHYPLMKTNDIIAMNIAPLAEKNAHLYLWTTNNFLPDALDVVKAWGFRYVTLITWAKDRMGIGQYFRGMTEHCIFAVRGSLPYRTRMEGGKEKRNQGTTLISAKRTKHSVKPEDMRTMIESVSPPPLFRTVFSQTPSRLGCIWVRRDRTDPYRRRHIVRSSADARGMNAHSGSVLRAQRF